MSRRITLGPFNRVEGDLEVRLEVADGVVRRAEVCSPLFRGFERMLPGKDPRDALTIVPRICGICSVSQSAAAARALADAAGIAPPVAGAVATQLVHGVENLVDHLTHFYLFFMPDFTSAEYSSEKWHESVSRRFGVSGPAQRSWLAARANILHVMGLIAGKWPHTLAIQPGGFTRAPDASERMRLLALVRRLRRWVDEEVFGGAGAAQAFAELDDAQALLRWQGGDAGRFIALAQATELFDIGAGPGLWLSCGAHEIAGEALFAAGQRMVDDEGVPGPREALDVDGIVEETAHTWDAAAPAHPREGETLPDAERAGAYSWCKAPRLHGRAAEVGALARQVVDGHALALDLAKGGGSAAARIIGRLLEVARLLPALEEWALRLDPAASYMTPWPGLERGRGQGLVEAARGMLGHWLSVEEGRIARYQIIAPTTWNFSPRDAAGRPGPLEQALVGVRQGMAVHHVVRSFDPCMVCTVH